MSYSTAFKSSANVVVQAAVDAAIASGNEIGLQVAAYHKGELVVDVWGGLADETTGRKVDGDTLFNVFSVTKAVVATAIHLLVDRGHLEYDVPVARYWPEYGAHGKDKTTVRHVLTHRACVPQMPEGVTVEKMCDWHWMTTAIADLKPLAEPGSKTLYLSMTFGWILGELVRRADPHHRSIGRFVREEIARPLGITDLWIGIPDALEARIAKLTDAIPPVPAESLPPLFLASMPESVALGPSVFERPEVRCAEVPGVGGIFTARAEARFWAMLAQGGELDGVRLLSRELAATLNTPRANSEELDTVMFSIPLPITIGGYWFGGEYPPVGAARYPRAICHPGHGSSIGWADPVDQLAVAICHNRMSHASSPDEDSMVSIANAVRQALGL